MVEHQLMGENAKTTVDGQYLNVQEIFDGLYYIPNGPMDFFHQQYGDMKNQFDIAVFKYDYMIRVFLFSGSCITIFCECANPSSNVKTTSMTSCFG